jgi:hypothetical protein
MLSKVSVQMKASFLLLRFYLLCVFGIAAINVIVLTIVNLATGINDPLVSVGNMLTVSLIPIAIVLPLGYFKRIINLGASRKEYYFGLLMIYTIWSALFAVFNILWLKLENSFFRDSYNILEVFHWDQFGLAGMFLYQFGFYMLLISLLNLLFSGLRHFAGWIIWIVLIVAIPIGTALPSLRPKVGDGFLTFLSNDSLWQGFGINFLLSCLFLAGGWWFTSRRAF